MGVTFSVDRTDNCAGDFLKLINMGVNGSVWKRCGTIQNFTGKSRNNYAKLDFKSDGSQTKPGFKLRIIGKKFMSKIYSHFENVVLGQGFFLLCLIYIFANIKYDAK